MSTTDTPLLSPRFALALQFANQIHARQMRKGKGAPYISHLMAVSALVLEYGGNEVMFGSEVADIVACCTDTFEQPKPEWRPRTEAYIERLRHEPESARLVVTADKLHNLSNTLRDIRAEGAEVWRERMTLSPNGSP